MSQRSIESHGPRLDPDFKANPIQRGIQEFSEFLKPYDWKIGIDGPAASGKGTLVELFEQHLDIPQLPTGLMYRAVTFSLLIDHPQDFQTMSNELLTEYLKTINIQFEHALGNNHIHLRYHTQTEPETIKLTQQVLELPRINETVSQVAKRIPVREFLAPQQKKYIMESKRIVAEGRDMYQIAPRPTTDLLLYVYASDEVLIQREIERQRKKAINITEDQARISITERNRNDIQNGKLLSVHQAKATGLYSGIIDTTSNTKGETFLQILHMMALHQKVTPALQQTLRDR